MSMDGATGSWDTLRQHTAAQQTTLQQPSVQQSSRTNMMDATARTWEPTTHQYAGSQRESIQQDYQARLMDSTTGSWSSQPQQAAPTQPPQYVTPIEHQHFLQMIRTMIQQQIPQFLMPINQQLQQPTYYQQNY